jgi:hypothetical protein
MKKLREKKGFTIDEVILSIAIFAAIALPLFSVFVQSVKTDVKADAVLNANYISQDYIEKLDAKTYVQALTDRPNAVAVGGYKLSAQILPFGTVNSLFSGFCGYVHVIMNEDGTMLAVMPDGKWQLFGSVPSSISLSVSGGAYTFTCGYNTIAGNIGYSYCAMLINAMKKPSATLASVTVDTNCNAVHYCKNLHENDITITGTHETYSNIISGAASLIYVKASVYDASSSLIASSESYFNIKNW